MHFSFRQLQVFVETAHYENISKAADALAMSQSAASTALKELEKQFDVQLFDRVGKRLQLNSIGCSLRHEAEELLAKAHEFEKALAQQPLQTVVHLGATQTIGSYLAVGVINRFQQHLQQAGEPEAEITLNVANTQHIVEKLLNFEIDVALIEGEINHPDLQVQPWLKDELCIFAAPSNPYVNVTALKDKALLEADWILRERGSGTRQSFERMMAGIYPKMHIKLELEQTEAIKRAVMAGMGISCLSKLSVEKELNAGELVQLQSKERNMNRALYLVKHKDKYTSAGLRCFVAHCLTEAQWFG